MNHQNHLTPEEAEHIARSATAPRTSILAPVISLPRPTPTERAREFSRRLQGEDYQRPELQHFAENLRRMAL